jgi:hypothetical protein
VGIQNQHLLTITDDLDVDLIALLVQPLELAVLFMREVTWVVVSGKQLAARAYVKSVMKGRRGHQ